MLKNEIFALACRNYYDEQGLIVDKTNGEFAHSPLTRKECDTGYYLLWEHHQQQGLLQSKDLGKCCFFSSDTLKWLRECRYWPDNYLGLWDIYEQYAKKSAERLHAERDKQGRSIVGVKSAKRLNEALHREKDEQGRSIHGVKAAERLHRLHSAKAAQSAKLSRQKGIELTRICDEVVFLFDCIADAARALNLDPSSFSKVCRGKLKSTGGYTARYLT